MIRSRASYYDAIEASVGGSDPHHEEPDAGDVSLQGFIQVALRERPQTPLFNQRVRRKNQLDDGYLCRVLISRLLQDVAESVELRSDVTLNLFPEEEAQIAESVPKRRAEYASVRACARQALARLGLPESPLPRGERGAPVWPEGVTGSMTHCTGYRAAAVAWTSSLASLGIDAEEHGPLPDGVFESVSVPQERQALATLSDNVHWDRILFSAKESSYKAWFPLTGAWLDFHQAHLDLRPDGRFTSYLLVPGPRVNNHTLDRFEGRWLVADGLVLTAIAVPVHKAVSMNEIVP